MARGKALRLLVTGAILLALTGCGTVARQADASGASRSSAASRHDSSSPAQPPTSYQWPALSAYPPFVGSVTRSAACVASSQLEAATSSAPRIVQCWSGKVAGHSFVYAAFYTPNLQGYQLTVDGTTHIQATDGAPGVVYQFGGDFACIGSGSAAWMVAIDLATGKSYNPAYDRRQADIAGRYCASPDNPSVIASKSVIGIPARVPMK